MQSEPPLSDKVSQWLLTRLGASIATVVAVLVPALTALLPQETQQAVVWGVVLALVLLASFSLWTAAISLGRLRAKISKLEQEILSLRSRHQPELKDTSDQDRVLVEVYHSGDKYKNFSELTELSQLKVDACLQKLKEDKLIDFQLGDPWANNSRYLVTPKGKVYIVENHLIE